MLITEKQASKTWCPFQNGGRAWEHSLRPPPPAAADLGESVRLGVELRSCIGSKCMAWRWKADPDSRGPIRTPLYVFGDEKWTCEPCKGSGKQGGQTCGECDGSGGGRVQVPVGYCGLSGGIEV